MRLRKKIDSSRTSETRLTRAQNLLHINVHLARCLIGEFIGTALFVYIGLAVTAQAILSKGALGSIVTISLGWGAALLFAVQSTFRLSGAHLNPAVSLFMWTFGELGFSHLLLYSTVQTLGSFIAAALVHLLYIGIY
jgi:glycerol uptake facilitator-like aquaporin